MRTFLLVRDVDDTGISGTGIVAEGIEFSDKSVAMRWKGESPSTSIWANIRHMLLIHGHGTKSRVEWQNRL